MEINCYCGGEVSHITGKCLECNNDVITINGNAKITIIDKNGNKITQEDFNFRNEIVEFKDYFKFNEDYPDPTNGLLPINQQYFYISSIFLDGWINYVTIIKAFLITNYEPYDNNLKSLENFNDINFNHIHTKINKFFDDDVALLAKSKSGQFWFFYYDQDCSDCIIGRFETADSNEVVMQYFTNFCNKLSLSYTNADNLEIKPAIELDVKMFKGWISF